MELDNNETGDTIMKPVIKPISGFQTSYGEFFELKGNAILHDLKRQLTDGLITVANRFQPSDCESPYGVGQALISHKNELQRLFRDYEEAFNKAFPPEEPT